VSSLDASAPLPMTSYATLGLLSHDAEYTAVEIQDRAHQLLRYFYWVPALSHIRRELNRLEDLGYVSTREVKQGRVKRTLKYRVTAAGERALQEWAEGPYADPVIVKNPVVLRLWLGRRAGDTRLVLNALENQIEQLAEERDALVEALHRTDRILADLGDVAPDGPAENSPQAQLALARTQWHHSVMDYCLRDFEHNLRNSKRLLKELQELSVTIRAADEALAEDESSERIRQSGEDHPGGHGTHRASPGSAQSVRVRKRPRRTLDDDEESI
jgi:DNA-binding PadR family transcriptional regulator